MKLLMSPTSPYVRKVRVLLAEKNLQCEMVQLNLWKGEIGDLEERNPLRKIPVLITDEGDNIYDSRTIAAYLDAIAAPHFYPQEARARALVQSREMLADGATDAFVMILMTRTIDPDAATARWTKWLTRKVRRSLAQMAAGMEGRDPDNLDMGDIACACMLDFLSFRFPELEWRDEHAPLAAWLDSVLARDSFARTDPRQGL